MTSKIITGTITNGYTLSSSYSSLTITGSGLIAGSAGTPGFASPAYGGPGGAGGRALTVLTAATVVNQGAVTGGVGGAGGYGYLDGGNGGVGAGGLYLASGASLTNSGTTSGGAGGNGGASEFGHLGKRPSAGGVGGAGAVGLTLAGTGTITNSGVLRGGAGGTDGAGLYNQYLKTPGVNVGGVGIVASGAVSLVNNGGTIAGGAGGSGGAGYFVGAPGGAGGTAILASGGGTISNLAGSILGGAGGLAGTGHTIGAAGQVGEAVVLSANGAVINGSKTNATALISGSVGVYAAATASVTVTNYGTIQGGVTFMSSSDRLVAEGGSTLIGGARGGGGVLELAGGTGTITGLGVTGTLSGGETATFSGFGAYQIDAGGSWILNGTGAESNANGVLLTLNGALTSQGALIGVAGANGIGDVPYGTPGDPGTAALSEMGSGALTETGQLMGGAGGAGGSLCKYIAGAGGAGGAGLNLAGTATLTSAGIASGGAGGAGGDTFDIAFQGRPCFGGSGGAGGAGVALAAGATLVVAGTTTGGAGGAGGSGVDLNGVGGAGGAGVVLAAAGALANSGTITGGVGGAGAAGFSGGGQGGEGGAGVLLAGAGTVTNSGAITGGAGQTGGANAYFGGSGGAGGAGMVLAGGGVLGNTGRITGGAGGIGGQGGLGNGANGLAGDGVALTGGGAVVNGAKAMTTALISGLVGVYAGPTGAATVTNYGTIDGAGGLSVQFKSAGDRLIPETGSTWVGSVQGGGGTLELTGGTDTVSGLGSVGTLSGALAMTIGGFGVYVIDSGATLVPTGTNTFAANQSLTNFGHINGALTLSAASDSLVVESGSFTELATGGGGALELAGGTGVILGLGGSLVTLSGAISGKFRGFGSYFLDAGGNWTLSGTSTLGSGQTLANAGTLTGGVTLTSPSTRVIAAAGSTWIGAVQGGGGTLELGGGSGTIANLGAGGTVSGAIALTGGGFGAYQLDAGGSWTLAGTSTLGANETLTDFAALTGGVTLTAASDHLGVGAGASISGAVKGGGGALELVSGAATITGLGATGTLSGDEVMTFSGFGAYVIDAGAVLASTGTNTLAANQTLTNFGSLFGGGVALGASSDRVVLESRSFSISLVGGGGALELAGATGTITGLGSAASLSGAISGKFRGFGSYFIDAGGTWTLSGTNTLAPKQTLTNFGSLIGVVALGAASDRVVLESGSFTGQLTGGGGALELAGATGVIQGLGSGGDLSGAISGKFLGFASYFIDAGGNWTLSGTNTVAAAATLSDKGTLTSTGALTVSGAITAAGTLAISGGTATIVSGATVTVATLSLSGGTTSLNENLTYKGAFTEGAGAIVTLGSTDTLTLSGASILGGLINGAGTVVVANAAVSGLTIGGTDALSDNSQAMQTGALTIGDGAGAKASLSIAKGATWTINGAVGIAHGASAGSSLKVAGTLIKSGAKGISTINLVTTDTGLIEAASGTLDLAGKLGGTGELKIDARATLEVGAATASTLTTAFNGPGATLALKAPTTFAATIAGLAVGDTIDLLKITATGASVNGADQLVIINGTTTVATLQLSGAYSGATFSVGSDGKGGTNLTLLTAARAPSPTGLISAMAGLGARAGPVVAAGARVEPPKFTLLTRA